MKYLLIHALDETVVPNESACASPSLPDWIAEMEQRGIVIDGARLHPVEDATTVRRRDGETLVLDGPFAETKEQVAGYDLIEAKDLDEAIAVAAAHPTTYRGSIEIRPVAPGMPTPDVTEPKDDKHRYLMFVCWDQTGDGEIPDEPEPADFVDPMGPWLEETGERRLHGWQLQPPSQATTVRNRDGKVVVTDGPFAETKEQIGGYDLLECDDLDDAIGIAKSHGVGLLELRPLWAS